MATKKEITIYDLADKLKISPTTVSRGLKDHPSINKATKKRIFDLAEEVGYRTNHFARNLRQQRTNTIGVIVPLLISNFTSTVIAGMENVVNKAGYNLLISQSLESYKKEVANAKTMFDSRVDGLLVSLANESMNIDHFDLFFNKNLPLVFFDRVEEHKNCTSIMIDNRKAAYNVTTHLIKQGCKRIVHITTILNRNVYIDRLNGYKEALSENDIKFKEEYLIIGNLSQDAGAKAAEIIRQMSPLPDAVFAANDITAVGCILALNRAGIRVPEDIAVAGFNNDPVSRVIEPNLTTIDYRGYEMGETAAQHMINHLTGLSNIKTTHTIILRSELITRASSLKS
ncbi:MAG: transcriptional regulator, LacI family [Segetibacter sp.]|jgi:LacI family transcriptional regulator|nr:transcriptional regulator, LacI family [Segetibacter sp.]